MKISKAILILAGLSFSLLLKSQSNLSTSTNQGMKAQFSQSSLQAYQESSLSKVEDFYQYLELLSDETVSQALKNELKETIYSQFQNTDVQVYNFTEEPASLITLNQLLTFVEKDKSIKFTIKNENSLKEIYSDYWINSYTLEVSRESEIQIFFIKQKVYFSPQLKKFGEREKEVWTMLLGEME